jgi:hypothetical protein
MNSDWASFSKWEHSTGNKWFPLEFRGLRKKWKYTVQGELKSLLPSGDETRLLAVSGKEWALMLDLEGREIWNVSLMPTYRPHASTFPQPIMILAEWFYPETIFVKMAGIPNVMLNPDTGEVIKQCVRVDGSIDDFYHPNMTFGPINMLLEGKWFSFCNPNAIAQIQRSGFLGTPERTILPPCLGWVGSYSTGDGLIAPLAPFKSAELGVEVIIAKAPYLVYRCLEQDCSLHIRAVHDGDFAGAVIIKNGTDAFITGEGQFLVTKHHDAQRRNWWLECRRMNELGNVIWRTESCGWLYWFLGTGNTVWYTELTGIQGQGKDWLIGLDLETGKEFHRKAEPCRYFGMVCGSLFITANGRSITAWEPAD